MAADLNSSTDSSDEEIISTRRRRLNSAKKRERFQDSDDDSSGKNSSFRQLTTPGDRSSDRIRRRQSREFQMPDKHAYREQIVPSSNVNNKFLSPKKLVNNLMKVNSRYNADTFDTDEEDLSDFIVYDDEIDKEDESSDENQMKHKGRVDRDRTGFSASKRQRVREISSSDSETDTQLVNDKSVENSVKESNEQCSETISMKTSKNGINSPGKNDCDEIPKTCNSTKRKSSRNILDSSEDDTNKDSGPKCESSDSDDSVLNTSSTNKKRKITSSDSESNSEYSSGSCRKSATSRIQERRKCREELFKGLKDSRRKSK